MQTFAKLAVRLARERGMFIVLDADGLYMIGNDVSIIKGYRRAVVTPNVVEFKRLSEQLGLDPGIPADERAALVSRRLGGVTVLQKGAVDIISTDSTGEEADLAASKLEGADGNFESAKETVEVDVEGGLKRVGGQGDVLSGSVGTFMAWGKCYEDGIFGYVQHRRLNSCGSYSSLHSSKGEIPASRIPLLAAVGASMVTRTTSRLAYQANGRSLITADMLSVIGKAFEDVFEEPKYPKNRI